MKLTEYGNLQVHTKNSIDKDQHPSSDLILSSTLQFQAFNTYTKNRNSNYKLLISIIMMQLSSPDQQEI